MIMDSNNESSKSFFPCDTLLGDAYSLDVFNNALWDCYQI